MGSSDITSRLVAHTTEDTGLAPAGVTAARPGADETWPGDEADPLPDPEHAATAIVPAATTAMTAARLCLRFISTPRLPRSFGELASRPASHLPGPTIRSLRPVISARPRPAAIACLTCLEPSGKSWEGGFSRHEGHD